MVMARDVRLSAGRARASESQGIGRRRPELAVFWLNGRFYAMQVRHVQGHIAY